MEPQKQASPLFRDRKIQSFEKADRLIKAFSITEKALFFILFAILAGCVLALLAQIGDKFSVNVPKHGGSLVEGIVGTPRFVNPLLAVSDADRDLTALVYSGLLKDAPDGSVVTDLASDYSVSTDGLTYTVDIKPTAKFSDGAQVTADDVVYTVQEAQDSALKSPRFVNWQGVSVQKSGIDSVVFKLKQPYAPFVQELTLGILPAHLWKALTADQIPFSSLNTNAVGSGPYIISSVSRSSDGIPTAFALHADPTYTLGQPYITDLTIKSYSDEASLVSALQAKQIDSASNLSPASAAAASKIAGETVMTAPLTRIFGVFFNQNQNEILAHAEVRQALGIAIGKDALVNDILKGYGSTIDGPLPPTVANQVSTSTGATASSTPDQAAGILAKAGWKKNPSTGIYELHTGKGKASATTTLALTLSTADVPELVLAAKKIEDDWTALGVAVDVKVFEPADLNESVIRPRKYDALLFGLVTGETSDLYPFWHSSQRNDPGLNIALYTNTKADALLQKMRVATSSSAVATEYAQFKAMLAADDPAIFLWSPDFLYAVPADIQGVKLGDITTSSDRFLGIQGWYMQTDHVWNGFN